MNMKKFALALLSVLALATIFVASSPASAQPSANDYYSYAEHNCNIDPGYCSAVRGAQYKNGSNNGYGYNNGYGQPVDETQSDVTCVSFLGVFAKCSRKRQPMVCYTPAGDPIMVDGHGARYMAGGNAGRPMPREVQLNCGNNHYRASN